jgi:hypothetical protein
MDMEIVGDVILAAISAVFFAAAYMHLRTVYRRYQMGLPRAEFMLQVIWMVIGLLALIGFAIVLWEMHWI